jgi:hypothetical protein
MLRAVAADAFFGLAVFIETAAAVSLLQLWGIPLREELAPILAFYHSSLSFGPASSVGPATFPAWFADAYVLAFVLFFFFFIAQFRSAMAPYNEAALSGAPLSSMERAVDATLPVMFCLLGAAFFSITLLPLLTPIAAFWLLVRKLAGCPSWFQVSRSYYANLLVVSALTAIIAGFAR